METTQTIAVTAAVARFYSILGIALLSMNTAATAQDFWMETESPRGGFVHQLAINSQDQIYAAVNFGGLYRTLNHGDNWSKIVDPFGDKNILSVAIGTAGDIYVSTYWWEGGMLRSRDGGLSWSPVNLGLPAIDTRLFAHRINGHIFALPFDHGVYRLADNLDRWIPSNIGLPDSLVLAIASGPSGEMLISTFTGSESGEYSSVYSSVDNGLTWTPLNAKIDSLIFESLAVDSHGHIYAGSTNTGVHRSQDHGSSWEPFNAGLKYPSVYSLSCSGDDQIFAGSIDGVFRSNSSSPWEPATIGIEHTLVFSFAFDKQGNIFAGTYGHGVFRSNDDGMTWQYINNGFHKVQINAFVTHPNGQIFAGSVGAGLFRSDDDGRTWFPVVAPFSNIGVSDLEVNSNGDIFGSSDGGGICRSTDGGNTWSRFDIQQTTPFVSHLAIHPGGSVFAGTEEAGILRSTDNGETWGPAGNGFNGVRIGSLVITKQGRIFASSRDGYPNNAFQSTNGGESWTPVHFGNFGSAWKFLGANENGTVFVRLTDGVFRSVDHGATWQPAHDGTSNTDIESLVINSRGHLFAGALQEFNFRPGVFFSRSDGDTWVQINEGLTNLDVRSLGMSPNGHVLVGTRSGLFRSIETTTAIAEPAQAIPNKFMLAQNYPNPFNAGTQIRYELPAGKMSYPVVLTVYDLQGRLIKQLVNTTQAAGVYSVAWEGIDSGGKPVPTQVYICSLQIGEWKETRKLLLLR